MSRITFTRRHGGHVASYNGMLSGMILSPESDIESGYKYWRVVSMWGDVTQFRTLVEAKEHAARNLIYDESEMGYAT